MVSLAQGPQKPQIKQEVTELTGAKLIQLTERPAFRDGQVATGKYSLMLSESDKLSLKLEAKPILSDLKQSVSELTDVRNVTDVIIPASISRHTRKNLANIIVRNFPNAQVRSLKQVSSAAVNDLSVSRFPAADTLDRANTDGHTY